MSERNYFVHETACVEEGAIIGDWTKIWHFSQVMNGAKIGENCFFGQNIFVDKNVSIGNHVTIQNIVSEKRISKKDDVFCGHQMVFVNEHSLGEQLPRIFGADQAITVIQQGASIEDHVLITCGVTIGKHAVIVAGSEVIQDVPAYAIFAGSPARHIGWSCICGTKLVFKAEHTVCLNCHRNYHQKNERHIVKCEAI
ncbi:N-acetyltransferase [Brevibacillus sp. SYSU BS000544]|uniref:acyltransferase n=1 Tax=Brevibacillus sp. SYSU BS000544 TaxID=3416443 RepID=UPI003CE5850B